jgi:predicted nucleotidyltransferase
MDRIKIKVPRAEIARFCKRWNVSELAIFGSALRADFRPNSDVDVLVSFAPQAHVTLFDMAQMQEELKAIFDSVGEVGAMWTWSASAALNTAAIISDAKPSLSRRR